jgi:hypothetical protein
VKEKKRKKHVWKKKEGKKEKKSQPKFVCNVEISPENWKSRE